MVPSGNASHFRIRHFGGIGYGGFWSAVASPTSEAVVVFTVLAGNPLLCPDFYTGSTRRSQTASSSSTSSPSSSSSSPWIHLRSVLFVVTSSSPASCSSADSDRLKSPWSGRRKKHALSPQQWRSLFTPDGRLRNGGVNFLKKVRSRGVDPSIRAEVWPFLLGVYDLNSSKEERDAVRTQKRKEYGKHRRECCRLAKYSSGSFKFTETGGTCQNGKGDSPIQETDTSSSEDVVSAGESLSSDGSSPNAEYSDEPPNTLLEGDDGSRRTSADVSARNSESSDSDSFEDPEVIPGSPFLDGREENDPDVSSKRIFSRSSSEWLSKRYATEDFSTWQRIIRLDAIRANAEWMPHSPSQAAVLDGRARRLAKAVGLKDYDHLEPFRIFHAARLVAILEAYALYDPEIGYFQGMSDLLSPIISVIPDMKLSGAL
ncbi:Ypt/Rab-GAP domain of gyp1p superfamily protein isoform 2 [Hibiscus syriacus]|uniref:Ypt/Rab-GAP domain of gyp1p superfamily protein isoform 2 n=1 Tax=Hibiscus syriacus TaxID=106335 RepID=A0A6A2ZS56_HIBSY|nr:Ypt/Rab-GAP domain of gyp1p superfamily protein isoform 2 [Hibiscus syriacus]